MGSWRGDKTVSEYGVAPVSEAIAFSPYSREPGVVRTLAQLPESYLLYIGPVACARHDYLSGMYAFQDRISYLCLHELDVILGRTEVLVQEAAAEILGRTAPGTKAMILYTGCQNSLTGVDFDALVKKLKETHGIFFTYCNMNHMLRSGKGNVYPALYQSFVNVLEETSVPQGVKAPAAVNWLCPSLRLHTGNDLPRFLAACGVAKVNSIGASSTLAEVKEMARAGLNLVTHPDFLPAAKEMEEKWEIPWLYLPSTWRLEDIGKQYAELAAFFGTQTEAADLDKVVAEARREAEEAVVRTRKLLDGAALRLDAGSFLKPFSAARFFLEEGFRLEALVNLPDLKQARKLDGEGLEWLRAYHPELLGSEDSGAGQGRQWELHCMSAQLSEAAKPMEGAWFGYSGVASMMERLAAAWLKAHSSVEALARTGGMAG